MDGTISPADLFNTVTQSLPQKHHQAMTPIKVTHTIGVPVLFSILTLTSWLACIEPPPTATEGGSEPGGAAKPGAPNPGGDAPPGEANGSLPADGKAPNPEAAVVPTPHDGAGNGAPKAMYAQDAVPNGKTLTVELICTDCTGKLLVRVEDASKQPPILATQKSFDKPGTGSIVVPQGIKAVMMVVDDADGNDQPTPGENIGLWTGGLLDTSADHESITLEVGTVPDTPPLPPAEDDPTLKKEAE
jgi:hypothetical protein